MAVFVILYFNTPASFVIQPPIFTVSGKVVNQAGEPVAGAMITIDAHDFGTETNAQGNFTDSLRGARAGSAITVRAFHQHYQSNFVGLELKKGGTGPVKIVLNR